MFESLDFTKIIGIGMFIPYIIKFIIALLKIPIKYKYQIATNQNRMLTDSIMKKIINTYKYSSLKIITTNGIYPIGTVIGFWYIAQIKHKNDVNGINYEIYLYSFTDFNCKTNVSTVVSIVDTKSKNGNIFIPIYRKYKYHLHSHEKFMIKFPTYFITPTQHKISDYIKEKITISAANGFNYGMIVLITGTSGVGKSKIAHVLAKKINAKICDDFEMTTPNYNIHALMKTTKPTKKSPLILLLDEHDQTIRRIIKAHSENVTPMDKISFCANVRGKDSYNKFFDQLSDYDNVITILTSNNNIEWFKEQDKSYVRPGRINIHINISSVTYSITILKEEIEDIASKVNQYKYTKQKI